MKSRMFSSPKALGLLSALVVVMVGCTGPKGDTGPAGTPCAVTSNTDGTKTITCPDGTTATVANGSNGTNGTNGTNGSNGAAGTSCSVTTNTDGSKTIACTDGSSVVVTNGTKGEQGDAGTSCTVADNGNGTKTISCTDGTSAVVTDGAKGATGAAGTSCTVSSGAGSRTITCTDGTSVTITPPLATRIDPRDDLPGLNLVITKVEGASNTDGTFASGDTLKVTFTLLTNAGVPVMLDEVGALKLWVSGPVSNYQHILPVARDAVSYDVSTTAVQTAPGTYQVTLADKLPTNFGTPIFDTTKFTDGELSGPLTAGTYTVAMFTSKDYQVGSRTLPDVGQDAKNFLFGHATTLDTREVVSTANCNQCHKRLEAHGGHLRDTRLCVTCHTAGSEDVGSTDTGDTTPVTMEFKVMIHKLHSSLHLPSVQGVTVDAAGNRMYDAGVPYVVGTTDFSNLKFPAFPDFNVAMPKNLGYSALNSGAQGKENNVRMGITACDKCHGTPEGGTAPAQGGQSLANPNRRACGSCHDDIVWSHDYQKNGGTMHAQADDTKCGVCHTTLATDHTHPLEDATVNPQRAFAFTSVKTAAGATTFAAGDVPVVTFTLKTAAGADVALPTFDNLTMSLLGTTNNRQVVFPYPSTNGPTTSPFDFTGRLAAAVTTNKGTMSKVFPAGTTVSEVITLNFTSTTAFTVNGSVSGSLGTGTLPAAAGTQPTGATLTNFFFDPTYAAGNFTVAFTGPNAFTVSDTASTPNVLGTGTLPNTTGVNTLVRFVSTDKKLAFNVTTSSTAPASGNTFQVAVVKGAAANPVQFAVVPGKAAFAVNDRFYYDYAAPAATYTTRIPMDIATEFLGNVTGTPGQSFVTANVPAWYGRQTLYEAAVGTVTASLFVAAPQYTRYADVASVSTFAVNDYAVIDRGGANEEWVRIGKVETTPNTRLWFVTPFRFTHAAGAVITKATLTYRQEGVDYTLTPATGTVALVGTFGTGNAIVMSYRTDGRFGWLRKTGDTLQAVFAPPLNDGPNFDESWGDWGGKPYAAGTYTVFLYGYANIDYSAQKELQIYRGTTVSAEGDFLYGAATTVAPYNIISSAENCNACHNDLSFHGGGRRGADTCMLCHGIAGFEGGSYSSTIVPGKPGSTYNFRTFIHELHADGFPASPSGVPACDKCHGTATGYLDPPSRDHPTAQVKAVKVWTAGCVGCHETTAARAHISANTSASGDEACDVCHGPSKEFDVAVIHKMR
jgi:OmcA/MtrC family decaheme c-type cytochrome